MKRSSAPIMVRVGILRIRQVERNEVRLARYLPLHLDP